MKFLNQYLLTRRCHCLGHEKDCLRFNLYLKLFIVMGINWSMEIISWLYADNVLKYLWYVTDLTNTLQGVIIFLIFVWKDKIKRLLLRRFRCKSKKWITRNSIARTGCLSNSSMASRATCMTINIPLQEKHSNYVPDINNCHGKTNIVCRESDCI
ncbi:G-protein coupled receptor Mth2 [Copidosoma floridanum]|uniref:G-protein coupled receptor Mth2 n=1 Tax=Copidosoma floridanum TaxID=29053 RepID=UPI0006C9910B|nr:G-protein coupled receptor Mth2 [Copidosoma floridanum]